MIFNFTLRLNEVGSVLNVLLCHPLSISLRATFLVLYHWSRNPIVKKI